MAYSNDYGEIRKGFINYIGAAYQSIDGIDEVKKQQITAMLIEEAINFNKDKDGNLDLYALKPLLKGCKYLCEKRILALEPYKNKSMELRQQYINYSDLLKLVNPLIENIKL